MAFNYSVVSLWYCRLGFQNRPTVESQLYQVMETDYPYFRLINRCWIVMIDLICAVVEGCITASVCVLISEIKLNGRRWM
jgi:hypothetical protein